MFPGCVPTTTTYKELTCEWGLFQALHPGAGDPYPFQDVTSNLRVATLVRTSCFYIPICFRSGGKGSRGVCTRFSGPVVSKNPPLLVRYGDGSSKWRLCPSGRRGQKVATGYRETACYPIASDLGLFSRAPEV